MQPWSAYGCSASGADAADRLRVEGTVAKPWVSGFSNTSISDSLTQMGGTITVWGQSNRADEIVYWELLYVSGDCPFCSAFLPVTLTSFSAFVQENMVHMEWETASEQLNDYFSVEHSTDGQAFNLIETIDSGENPSQTQHYSAQVPWTGGRSAWWRLSQTDYNGTKVVLGMLQLQRELELPEFIPQPDGQLHVLLPEDHQSPFSIKVMDATGRWVRSIVA
ncbi:MAG: hypothetical protein JNM00_13140, partial [Flavobacteriales bacterium]|nr:hypothetical protein [Flavobacteriales bacterium]